MKVNKYLPFAIVLFAMLFLVYSCGAENRNKPHEAGVTDSTRPLKVSGTSIVDRQGNPVRLRGIYTRSTWLDEEKEAVWFGQWGVNFVRMLLKHDANYWQKVNNGIEDPEKRCIVPE